MKYKAQLVNKNGCVFDRSEFDTVKEAKSWAKDRGTLIKYKLVLIDGENRKEYGAK